MNKMNVLKVHGQALSLDYIASCDKGGLKTTMHVLLL